MLSHIHLTKNIFRVKGKNMKRQKNSNIKNYIILWFFIFIWANPFVLAQSQIELDKSLFDATEKGDLNRIKKLITKGANVNAKIDGRATTLWLKTPLGSKSISDDSSTPIIIAANQGHLEIVQELISNGALVNEKTNWGLTAISLAANKGQLDIVNELIKSEADINVKDSVTYSTPLIYSALDGNYDIVEILLNNGADVNILGGTQEMNISKDESGEILDWELTTYPNHLPVLIAAVISTNIKVVEKLLQHGVDIHSKDRDGYTALTFASKEGLLDIFNLLRKYGAEY